MVRGPLVYSWTHSAWPVDSRGYTGEADGCGVSVPQGKVDRIDADAASPGMEMTARRKEKQVPSPATNKVKSLANPPPSSCCFESVDQTQTLAAAGEKRKEESLFHSPFPFLLRFPSSLTGIGRNVATSCPWIVPAL